MGATAEQRYGKYAKNLAHAHVDWEIAHHSKGNDPRFIKIPAGFAQTYESHRELLRAITADAWAGARAIQALPSDALPQKIQRTFVNALYPSDGAKNVERKPHLFGGLDARKKKPDYDTSTAAGQKRLMDESVGYEHVAPSPIIRAAGRDHGADPIGPDENGVFMFRMVPSGDVVDGDERARRLGKKTIKGLAAKGDTWGTKRGFPETRELFHDLIQKEDPPRFEMAEDLLRENGLSFRSMMNGERVLHYVMYTKPMPPGTERDEYLTKERVVGGGFTPAQSPTGGDDRSKASWIDFYVRHGPSRYSFSKKLDKPIDADEARKMITATIWELSKRLAPFSNDVDEETIKRIAEKTVKQRHNIVKRYADLAG